ncbi:hypothetical protein [Clostridium sp.]|uniref:hypothetical protein n=1 Tax=Clostridium sp. TaxID=1506 RepID=UPI001A41308C|nr:hypothetical protein [Clostridium sp.]MBK5239861.1 hypothetical protein [Clostridium sp.]
MSDQIYKLTKTEAIEMLPDTDYIHTFRQGDVNCLIGADWTREKMLEMINENQFELTGFYATNMGHGMAFQDELGWIFVETKE